jgi:hypothetical protein
MPLSVHGPSHPISSTSAAKSLLIVGRDLGEIAAEVLLGGAWEVHYPCSSPAELAAILSAQRDGSIERLDICDHGGPGFLHMGDTVLFGSDPDPESPLEHTELAIALRDKLTATAQVRLLGCDTAGKWGRRRAGRLMLLKLARLLNEKTAPRANRIVFGTITGVQPSDFDEHGLRHASELTLLYSSYAALDHDAPDYDTRLDRVAALHGDAPIDFGAPAHQARRARATPVRAALRRLVSGLPRPRRAPAAAEGAGAAAPLSRSRG